MLTVRSLINREIAGFAVMTCIAISAISASSAGPPSLQRQMPEAPSSKAGTYWALESLGEEQASAHAPDALVLIFAADGGLGGKLACNGFGGRAQWHADGTFSSLSPLIVTTMGCGNTNSESYAFADRVFRMLEDAQRWSLVGGALQIRFADGQVAKFRQVAMPASL